MSKCLFIIILLMFSATSAHAAPPAENSPVFSLLKNNTQTPKERARTIERIKNLKEVTGLEWFQMSVEEKQEHILASMLRLEAGGMTFEGELGDYSYRIQKKLYADPGLYEADLTAILRGVVEDAARGERPAVKKIEMH